MPGLSLSDLPVPAAAVHFVVVVGSDHDNDDVDDDGGCFDVLSAITIPVLDGRWDENVLTHTNILVICHALREKSRQEGLR